MRPDNFNIQEVIDHLQGTCKSLDEGLNNLYPEMELEELTTEDHEAIDSEIFNCDTCSWWCEISEQDEDGNCNDCSETEEED